MFSWFGLSLLVQIGLIVHVLRTGRPLWWILILLIAPFLGSLAYVLVEIVPGLGNRSAGPSAGWSRFKPRALVIADLRARLAEGGTVALRLQLAEQLLAAGAAAEADEIASGALSGPFKDDPTTLVDVARFKLEQGRCAEALALLDRADIQADRMLTTRKDLLEGRACLGLGDYARAEAALQRTEGRHLGDEPRFWLAKIYLATGRTDAARTVLGEIRSRFRKSNPVWRRTEQRWYREAGTLLQQLPPARS
jgi:hypothetical protein